MTSSAASFGARERSWWFIPGVALVALLLTAVFFAPRLWLMREYQPGTTQWDRAHTYLQQCEQPFRRDIEPAMLWRLLPPLVAHTLRLPGRTPLLLPWLGLIASLCYVAVILRRQLDDARFVFGGTLLYATTSAVLVPIGWLGINDAWVWLGLLAVAFGRGSWTTPLACLLCPWIDERFIIGFSLAWLVARRERNEELLGRALIEGAWLLPYAGIRLFLTRHDAVAGGATSAFLRTLLHTNLPLLPLVPLAWWMGLRAAWAAVGLALWNWPRSQNLVAAAVLVATLGTSVWLASDLSRSVAIAGPVVIVGCLTLARRWPDLAPRLLLGFGVLNLLLPAAHMTYLNIDPISPLPIELFRLLR
jgi:hypothetical protein